MLKNVLRMNISPFAHSSFTFGSFGMKSVMNAVKRFIKNEDGPTAVEYAVMLALIIVLCIVVIRNVGTSASATFSSANSAIS
jgi:pilus assembly protein Flp/PilA